MQEVGIGTIKLFDPANKRGVITQQDALTKQGRPRDVYFEVSDAEALRVRVGQLVQFVLEDTDMGPVARDITVLSEKA